MRIRENWYFGQNSFEIFCKEDGNRTDEVIRAESIGHS